MCACAENALLKLHLNALLGLTENIVSPSTKKLLKKFVLHFKNCWDPRLNSTSPSSKNINFSNNAKSNCWDPKINSTSPSSKNIIFSK
jgi:hypothetical protein